MRSRLRHARNRIVFVQRHAGNHAGVLRSAALHDAVAVGGVGRAQNRERQAAVPEHRAGNLPAVQRVRQHAIANLERQLVDVLRGEIVADIVIARAVLPAEFARAAARESRPRRKAGIRRSRPCPCSGSRCSSPAPGSRAPAACRRSAAGRCSGCSRRCSTASRRRSEDLPAARKETARSSPGTPSDSRSPASGRAGSPRASRHTARAD